MDSLIKIKAECLKLFLNSSPITQGREIPKRHAGPAAVRSTHSLHPLVYRRNNPAQTFLLAVWTGWLPSCFRVRS